MRMPRSPMPVICRMGMRVCDGPRSMRAIHNGTGTWNRVSAGGGALGGGSVGLGIANGTYCLEGGRLVSGGGGRENEEFVIHELWSVGNSGQSGHFPKDI